MLTWTLEVFVWSLRTRARGRMHAVREGHPARARNTSDAYYAEVGPPFYPVPWPHWTACMHESKRSYAGNAPVLTGSVLRNFRRFPIIKISTLLGE